MEKIKALNIRLPSDVWIFIKHKAMMKETSINQLIIKYIRKEMKALLKKSLQEKNKVVP